MTRFGRFVATSALVIVSMVSLSAQERRSGGGSGLPPYDVSKEITVSGVLTGTEEIPTQTGTQMTVLILSVNNAPMHVMLAPEGWIKMQKISVDTGAKVEATGLSGGFKIKGDAAMLARQLKVGGKVIALRDAKGAPLWEK